MEEYLKQSLTHLKVLGSRCNNRCVQWYGEVSRTVDFQVRNNYQLQRLRQLVQEGKIPEMSAQYLLASYFHLKVTLAFLDTNLRLALVDHTSSQNIVYNEQVAMYLFKAGAKWSLTPGYTEPLPRVDFREIKLKSKLQMSVEKVYRANMSKRYCRDGVDDRKLRQWNRRVDEKDLLKRMEKSGSETGPKAAPRKLPNSLAASGDFNKDQLKHFAGKSEPSPPSTVDNYGNYSDHCSNTSNAEFSLNEVARLLQQAQSRPQIRTWSSDDHISPSVTPSRRHLEKGTKQPQHGGETKDTSRDRKESSDDTLFLRIPADVHKIVLEKNGQKITVEV